MSKTPWIFVGNCGVWPCSNCWYLVGFGSSGTTLDCFFCVGHIASKKKTDKGQGQRPNPHRMQDTMRAQIGTFFLWCCLHAVWTPPFTSTGCVVCLRRVARSVPRPVWIGPKPHVHWTTSKRILTEHIRWGPCSIWTDTDTGGALDWKTWFCYEACGTCQWVLLVLSIANIVPR